MRNYLTIVFFPLLSLSVYGQAWVVPPDKHEKLSSFPFTDETRKAGEQLYTINCKTCHGTPRKGDVLKLVPLPLDPASAKFQLNSDGDLFYKITEGRGQMPTFKNVLSSVQIWEIISYLRSFNNSYQQKVARVITSSAYPGAEITIELSYIPSDTAIVLSAKAIRDNIVVPVTDAGVRLFIQRTFGMLQSDEEKITDKEGLAIFDLPRDVPADSAGNISISAKFTNEEVFGALTSDTLIQTGNKSHPAGLVGRRAMWNTVWKAPIWVILAYFGGLLLVLGVILYVLLMLRDIFIIGDTLMKDESLGETEIK